MNRGRFIPCRFCPTVECTCMTELEDELLTKLDVLRKKADRLVQALEFYADYMNYSLDYETSGNGFSRRCILYSDIEERNEATGLAGRRAREALQEFKGEE